MILKLSKKHSNSLPVTPMNSANHKNLLFDVYLQEYSNFSSRLTKKCKSITISKRKHRSITDWSSQNFWDKLAKWTKIVQTWFAFSRCARCFFLTWKANLVTSAKSWIKLLNWLRMAKSIKLSLRLFAITANKLKRKRLQSLIQNLQRISLPQRIYKLNTVFSSKSWNIFQKRSRKSQKSWK